MDDPEDILVFRMKKSVAILSVCARFHTFCLLMDDDKKIELANGMEFLTSLELVDPMPNAPLGWCAYRPTVRKLDVVHSRIVYRFGKLFLMLSTTMGGFRRPPANVMN